ncbi:hypothetical protein [Chitinophaga flava]|uniref:Uncharacterized protein n=1 Tax=Chitinophaga flava TaxID=2259036 RepID=A0A365XZC7_9BACT|nr:hypothetical protein [Chitinophaga flava]RBL91729.1 hypothetical protein DF182_03735 [Chitinophaga flava]
MIYCNKRSKKTIAFFLLSILAYQIGFPIAAYALTAGPTSPETSSFEPVDTTDMVNLQSGDFNYNMPLVEVPGPEGNFPLSLSYHAGITTNEEASWVGLGWTLNPGAINRSENGYADDDNASDQFARMYWSGTEGRTVGLGLGVALRSANVSLGLGVTFTNNNKGFSVDFDGLTVGLSQSFRTMGGNNASIGLNTNLKTLKTSTRLSTTMGGAGSLGIDLSSAGASASFSLPGQQVTANLFSGMTGNEGMQTQTSSWAFNVPLFGGLFNIGLSSSYYRTWQDYSSNTKSYGSLFLPEGAATGTLSNQAFDTYHMFDLSNGISMFRLPEPSFHAGPGLPDYDLYMVNAQGLNGSIRPYQLQGYAIGGNRVAADNVTIKFVSNYTGLYGQLAPGMSYKVPETYKSNVFVRPSFRFINDFSNSYTQNLNNFVTNSLYAPFDQNPLTGDGIVPGYDPASLRVEGSRHIEYFTESQIMDGSAKSKGFIDVAPENSLGLVRYASSRIGGFSITNEKGITYHYGLPAYTNDGVTYSRNVKKEGDTEERWSKQVRHSLYAYTWLLTSITGPDFVDRDGNGVANEGDYGYWVNLGYGKWTGAYNWRTPATGFTKDVDAEFESYSQGNKELYYLNTINTRTHTAIFEKDIRQDGKGVDSTYAHAGFRDNRFVYGTFSAPKSKPVLKLNRILLLNNSDARAFSPQTGAGLQNMENTDQGKNVFDKYDLAGTGIESKALRIIQFNHDYSLCPQTPNSFDNSTPAIKTGKLTLLSVATLGKQGASVLPPVTFDYEFRANEKASISGPLSSSDGKSGSVKTLWFPSLNLRRLSEGDLITVKGPDNMPYTGVVTYETLLLEGTGPIKTMRYEVRFKMADPLPVAFNGQSVSVETTKNPRFNQDAYDKWGYYKCDYDAAAVDQNNNVGRTPTPASARNTDAWSLRRISTALGANIEVKYESDSYSTSVLNNRCSMIANNFSFDKPGQQISFKVENTYGERLSDLLPLNTKCEMTMGIIPAGGAKPAIAGISTADNMAYVSTYRMYNYYPGNYFSKNLPLVDNFIIKSVNDATGMVTISCTDPFVMGNSSIDVGSVSIQLSTNVVAGNVYFYRNNDPGRVMYGGGIRVRELGINSTDRITSTVYDYRSVAQNNLSSGVTSYEPNVIQKHTENFTGLQSSGNEQGDNVQKAVWKGEYRELINRASTKIVSLSRILPAPGVMYKNVAVTTSVANKQANGAAPVRFEAPGATVYTFKTPDENAVNLVQLGDASWSESGWKKATRNFAIQDNTAGIGAVLAIDQLDNNGKYLSRKKYNYVSEVPTADRDAVYAKYGNQGRIVERFVNRKGVDLMDDELIDWGIMTSKTENANFLTSETSTDYKTGQTTTTNYLGYDYYSGEAVKTTAQDAYGNTFMTEVVPAYRKYSQMGMKVGNLNNKHMLTQSTGSYVYKVDANNNKLGLVSASVSTWGNDAKVKGAGNAGLLPIQNQPGITTGNVWRRKASYVWAPAGVSADGITPLNQFTDFNWTNPLANSISWLKTRETTLYNVYSNELEGVDLYGNAAATLMGYDESKVLISGTFARQKDLAFTGAEDELSNGMFSGGIGLGDGVVEKSAVSPALNAHTGYNSLRVDANKAGFNCTINLDAADAKKSFLASVWVKGNGSSAPVAGLYYKIGNGAPVSASVNTLKKAGNWYLISFVVPATTIAGAASISFGCMNNGAATVYFDDFRVQPGESLTSAYVYDKFSGELIYVLNNNNLFTRYAYDAAGRLKATYKETFANGVMMTGSFDYNYGKGF